jgi:hypothetical protein
MRVSFAAIILAAGLSLGACGTPDKTVVVTPQPGQAVVVPSDDRTTVVVPPSN